MSDRLLVPIGICGELSSDEEYICLLEDGHTGAHEWTPA